MKTTPNLLKPPWKAFLLGLSMLLLFSGIARPQSIIGVEPGSGHQGQILELMISGQNTNFTQATQVNINLMQGTTTMIFPFSVTVENDELVKAVFNFTYLHETGMYDLGVFSYPQVPMFLEAAFELEAGPNPPALTGIEPETAETGQTLDVTISGQFTHFQASSTTVWFNQGSVTIYPNYNQVINDNEIKSNFTFQYFHPSGLYNVNTFNETDGQLTITDGFLLTAGPIPSITGLQPAEGMAGTYMEFNIYGENTHFQESGSVAAFLENFNSSVNLEVEIINNEHMTAQVILPYSMGNFSNPDFDLYVFTDLDGPMFLYDAFTAIPNPVQPYIDHIQPDSTYLGNDVIIEAFAANTFFTWSEYVSVWLQKDDWNNPVVYGYNILIDDDQKLTAQFSIPTYPEWAGLWDFIIQDNISGEMIFEGGFSVIDTITGINEPLPPNRLKVYPNPVSGYFNITSPVNTEDCTVGIFNLSGQQMNIRKIKFEAGIPVRFNTERYPDGIYTVKIVTQNEIIVKKIIKN
jgi:hypothetical protein